MRLQPRHFLLLALLLALGAWNLIRYGRAHRAQPAAAFNGPSTPAWHAFDHAAGLRYAADPQFTPALDTLRTEANAAAGPDAADLRNCLMWLQYYRHSAPMAAGSASTWGMLASGHVQSCMAEHRDLGR